MCIRIAVFCSLALTLGATGCSPAGMAVKVGMHLVGGAIDNEEVQQLSKQLVGKPASEADAVIGGRIDVWSDLNSGREWRTYPVKMDVLNRQRWVVECTPDRIAAVELFQKSDSEADIPLELVYYEKVKGKDPRACEAALGLGRPLLEIRSKTTNQLVQIYDGRLIKELQSPHNCVVRYDNAGRCSKVDMIQVPASSR